MEKITWFIVGIIGVLLFALTFIMMNADFAYVLKHVQKEDTNYEIARCDVISDVYIKEVETRTYVTIFCANSTSEYSNYEFIISGYRDKMIVNVDKIKIPESFTDPSYYDYTQEMSRYSETDKISTWTNVGLVSLLRYVSFFVAFGSLSYGVVLHKKGY